MVLSKKGKGPSQEGTCLTIIEQTVNELICTEQGFWFQSTRFGLKMTTKSSHYEHFIGAALLQLTFQNKSKKQKKLTSSHFLSMIMLDIFTCSSG